MIDPSFQAPPLSLESIRNTAEQLRECLGLYDPVFPVMEALEKRLDQELECVRMEVWSDNELGAYGGLSFRDGGGTDRIALSETAYSSAWSGQLRGRLTAAHEMGHWLLHTGPRYIAKPKIALLHGANEECEWQADAFAVELLMPMNMIRSSDTGLDLAVRFKVSRRLADARLRAAHNFWARQKKSRPKFGSGSLRSW